MATIFVTGFPGFLGSALVERLLRRYPSDVSVSCLIQAKFRPLAEKRAEALSADGRIRLLNGDITLPYLGLGEQFAPLQRETIEIFHLAAIYDLAVKRELGMSINVDGTNHILGFASGCPSLHRLHYVSTCYVSGNHNGVFSENDLQKGQKFNNLYEETKFLAEVAVQKKMRDGLPTTIYRPAIVVGDSQTGATQKYDGPYYLIQLIARQPLVAIVPVIGNPETVEMNIVPRDFVINAIDYLSGLAQSQGKVYQLADSKPLRISQLIDEIGSATDKRVLKVPVWKKMTKWALRDLPPVQWLTQVEAEGLDYFAHPTLYTSANTVRDLAGSGITCPPLPHYLPSLVRFWREHQEFGAKAMA